MSNTDLTGFAKPERFSSDPEGPLSGADWQARLIEARSRRDKVLSGQGGVPETVATAARSADPVAETLSPDAGNREGTISISRPTARKAFLIFCGAAGLGFGGVLGLGVSLGLRGSEAAALPTSPPQIASVAPVTGAGSDTQQDVAVPPEAVPSEVLAIQDTVLPEPKMDVVSLAPLLSVETSELVLPQYDGPELPFLPAISAVARRGGEVAPGQLNWLPQVSSAEFAETAYDGGALDRIAYFLHAPDGIPDRQLEAYVAELKQAGVTVDAIGRETFRVSSTHLRYYSTEDAAAAEDLADSLAVEARDFSQNTLNPGRIEIWVQGRPKLEEDVGVERTGILRRLFAADR